MNAETFYSEWFRVTTLTRKRMIHAQLGEINESGFRLTLTIAERSSLGDTTIRQGIQLLQERLKRIQRGEFE